MFYIYILYSEKSGKYYIGHTDDPNRRLVEHNLTERNTFTSKHRPWIMHINFQVSEDRGTAIRVERFIKKQKTKSFIEKLEDLDYRTKLLAQLVRVP